MYRIRTLEHKPVIISDAVLAEYGENKVETLHVKNLLSLGEDRYLTTVILKVSQVLLPLSHVHSLKIGLDVSVALPSIQAQVHSSRQSTNYRS